MNTAVGSLFNDNNLELAVEVGDLLLELCRILLNEGSVGSSNLRNISTSSEIFLEKFLQTSGALDILFLLGYREGEDCFQLPYEENVTPEVALLQQVLLLAREQAVHSLISQRTSPRPFTFNALPLPSNASEAALSSEMTSMSRRVQCHEDPVLQMKALEVLPLEELTARAQRRQSQDQHLSENSTWRDLLLLELLSWFKESFFRWMDIPLCPWCGGTTLATRGDLEDLDLHWGASRVEVYKCNCCLTNVRFPRYNDPGRLLFTRRGRCGEWANCFLLFLRALKFEARLVNDSLDHVWTEVYSEWQSRWLHCDPCENKCDTPLLYQDGWQKELSYVWAYAHDHVQDVTWRYSSPHRPVIQRRRAYREIFILSLLGALCLQLQPTSLSPERREQLLRKKLSELVEFLTPASSSTSECEGRTSGSLSWRLARGETGSALDDDSTTGFVFTPTEKEVAAGQMTILYSSIADKYHRPLSGGVDLQGWASGAWKSCGMFRKEERDWQKVYLCPREGLTRGSLAWRFSLPSGITSISVLCASTTFQKGRVQWTLSNGTQKHNIQNGELKNTSSFSGAKELTLSVELFCGDFWQHAQLFRTNTNSGTFADVESKWPLHISIFF